MRSEGGGGDQMIVMVTLCLCFQVRQVSDGL